jgi:hypothetical protein
MAHRKQRPVADEPRDAGGCRSKAERPISDHPRRRTASYRTLPARPFGMRKARGFVGDGMSQRPAA